jgi:hypothetical protein
MLLLLLLKHLLMLLLLQHLLLLLQLCHTESLLLISKTWIKLWQSIRLQSMGWRQAQIAATIIC